MRYCCRKILLEMSADGRPHLTVKFVFKGAQQMILQWKLRTPHQHHQLFRNNRPGLALATTSPRSWHAKIQHYWSQATFRI